MKIQLKTKRWDDPREPSDGLRVLITRYRPRGLKKADETWDFWWKELAPSAGLLADFHGKEGAPITWEQYRPRYLAEMESQRAKIDSLARHVLGGEPLTLLCSSACTNPLQCHRTLLEKLVRDAAKAGSGEA